MAGAYEENLKSLSYDADASLGIYTGPPGVPGSASPNYGMQYRAVKITGAHQVGLAVAAGGVVGILQNKPQRPGAACTVGVQGVSMAMSGAAISAGQECVPDGTGRFVPGAEATDAASLKFTAVTIAAGAGELVSLQIS
jgi:hypothetical protein